jgi:Ala-tRNA(Pro) deacylase
MSTSGRIRRFLKEQAADYQPLFEGEGPGAQRIAASVHVPGRQVAKVVVVRGGDGAALMAVLPATEKVDLRALAWATGDRALALATGKDLAVLFPDCGRGVVPPYGALYGIPVYVDPCLHGLPEIVFPAGDGRKAVAMRWTEFERLARPLVGQLCFHYVPGGEA